MKKNLVRMIPDLKWEGKATITNGKRRSRALSSSPALPVTKKVRVGLEWLIFRICCMSRLFYLFLSDQIELKWGSFYLVARRFARLLDRFVPLDLWIRVYGWFSYAVLSMASKSMYLFVIYLCPSSFTTLLEGMWKEGQIFCWASALFHICPKGFTWINYVFAIFWSACEVQPATARLSPLPCIFQKTFWLFALVLHFRTTFCSVLTVKCSALSMQNKFVIPEIIRSDWPIIW